MRTIVRNVSIFLLALVTLFSTGGVHLIIHQCLHTGDQQIHFVELHGCCAHGDSHCKEDACQTGCCGSNHDRHETGLQGECCTDTIQFLKTDNADRLSVASTPASNWQIITCELQDFTGELKNQTHSFSMALIKRAPPGAPSPTKLCVFRT